MKSILNVIAHASIPVPYSIWVTSRLILLAAAMVCLYAAFIWEPYSWTNLMLGGMSVYVLLTESKLYQQR